MPNFIDLIFFLKTRKVNFAGNKRKKFEKSWAKTFIPYIIKLIFFPNTCKAAF